MEQMRNFKGFEQDAQYPAGIILALCREIYERRRTMYCWNRYLGSEFARIEG